jgi:hypothetical protein
MAGRWSTRAAGAGEFDFRGCPTSGSGEGTVHTATRTEQPAGELGGLGAQLAYRGRLPELTTEPLR